MEPGPVEVIAGSSSDDIRSIGMLTGSGERSTGLSRSLEEPRDDLRAVLCSVDDQQVACAADDLQPGRRDPAGEDARVAWRHDGVLVARQDEGGRTDTAEPRQARPRRTRDELAGVPPEGGRPGPAGADLLAQEVVARSDRGPVEHAGREPQEGGGVVAQGRGQQRHGQRVAGDAPEPAGGRGEDQAPDPVRVAEGKLLSHRAPERDAEHVGVRVAERVEQVGRLAGQARHPLRDEAAGRVPGARRVVGDRLDAVGVEGPLERAPHLDVPAEAHDQQQGWSIAPDGHSQQVAVDLDEREEPVGLVGRNAGHRWTYRPGAGSIAGWRRLPRRVGARRSGPDRSPSHPNQWSHQLPSRAVAPARHSWGSAGGGPGRVRNRDRGLPGGFTMAWMWPLDPRTNWLSPPSICVVRYAPVHGMMWSVAPATT